MQQYYNKISEQKRIAFIDNLTDQKAKELSNEYPFAICFASKENYPVIWYNKKRYGFTNISNNIVQINDVNVGLHITDNGVIELYVNSLIDAYMLNSIENLYLANSINYDNYIINVTSPDILEPNTTSGFSEPFYIINTIQNKVLLKFNFLKNNQIINDINYNIEFNTSPNYNIIRTNDHNYILEVKQSSYLNAPVPETLIHTYITINGNNVEYDFRCLFYKVPEKNNWYFDNNTNIPSFINIYDEDHSLIFKFEDENESYYTEENNGGYSWFKDHYNVNIIVNYFNNNSEQFDNTTTISIHNANSSTNDIDIFNISGKNLWKKICNNIQSYENIDEVEYVILSLQVEDKNNSNSNNDNYYRILSNNLQFYVNNTLNDIFFIGDTLEDNHLNRDNYVDNNAYVDEIKNIIGDNINKSSETQFNDNTYADIYNSWCICKEFNFNNRDSYIPVNKNTVIILPANYVLTLSGEYADINDVSFGNEYLVDPMWISDENYTITINSKEYFIYIYNLNSTEINQQINDKFISDIKRINI